MKPKSLIPKLECQNIVEEFEAIFAQAPDSFWQDDVQSDARLYFAESHSPLFRRLYDLMLGEHEAVYGKKPQRYSFLMMNRVVPRAGNKGSGGGWHRDSWRRQAKTFAFLTDVSEKNGPFEYVVGTNRLLHKIWDYLWQRRSLRAAKEPAGKKVVTLTVPAGSVVTLDTTLLHRGRPIEDGVRYAATLYVFDVSSKKAEFLEKKFSAFRRPAVQEAALRA